MRSWAWSLTNGISGPIRRGGDTGSRERGAGIPRKAVWGYDQGKGPCHTLTMLATWLQTSRLQKCETELFAALATSLWYLIIAARTKMPARGTGPQGVQECVHCTCTQLIGNHNSTLYLMFFIIRDTLLYSLALPPALPRWATSTLYRLAFSSLHQTEVLLLKGLGDTGYFGEYSISVEKTQNFF